MKLLNRREIMKLKAYIRELPALTGLLLFGMAVVVGCSLLASYH
jgi:hypothetical protein